MPSQEIEVNSPTGISVRIEPSFIAKDYIPPASLGTPRPQEGQADGGIPILYLPGDMEGWKRLLKEKVVSDARPKAVNLKFKEAKVIPDLTQMLHQGLAQEKARIQRDQAMDGEPRATHGDHHEHLP